MIILVCDSRMLFYSFFSEKGEKNGERDPQEMTEAKGKNTAGCAELLYKYKTETTIFMVSSSDWNRI